MDEFDRDGEVGAARIVALADETEGLSTPELIATISGRPLHEGAGFAEIEKFEDSRGGALSLGGGPTSIVAAEPLSTWQWTAAVDSRHRHSAGRGGGEPRFALGALAC